MSGINALFEKDIFRMESFREMANGDLEKNPKLIKRSYDLVFRAFKHLAQEFDGYLSAEGSCHQRDQAKRLICLPVSRLRNIAEAIDAHNPYDSSGVEKDFNNFLRVYKVLARNLPSSN